MIFYTKFDRLERKSDGVKKKVKEVFSDCGNPIGLTYNYKFVDGKRMLVSDGEVNRQEFIDSFAESQDINVMISKFLQGDTSVLNPSLGTYGDFTDAPQTYAEIFDRVEQCKRVFDQMPVEIKAKFDNSYESFWSKFGDDYFNKVFDDFNNVPSGSDSVSVEPDPVSESEVK